jgi:hypothetical protein
MKLSPTSHATPHIRSEDSCSLKNLNSRFIEKCERKVNTVACPKCKAKIGFVKQQLATQAGTAFGFLCYICGCWIQRFPGHEEMAIKPLDVPLMTP